jgi:hypothetical protein
MSKKMPSATVRSEKEAGELMYANDVSVRGSKKDLIIDLRLVHPEGCYHVARVYMAIPVAEAFAEELSDWVMSIKQRTDEDEAKKGKTLN